VLFNLDVGHPISGALEKQAVPKTFNRYRGGSRQLP
jgi:hypothetical protein